MSEKEALQNAADEARKVARAAREFGGLLDNYAKYLTQRNWQGRADELHLLALEKLNAINDGLAICNTWVKESRASAAAQPLEPTNNGRDSKNQNVLEPGKPRAVQIKKRETIR